MSKAARPTLAALTGLRFLAALHVIACHVAQSRLPGLAGTVASAGYLALSLFFVLSGFVMTYMYAGRPVKLRSYAVARVARIYPMYLLALVVALAWGEAPTAVCAGAALTLTQGWLPECATAWNSPGWSLSVEAFFYASFPLVVHVTPTLARRPLTAVAALTALGMAAPAAYLLAQPDQIALPSAADHAWWLNALKYSPIAHAHEFLIGAITAHVFLSRDFRMPRPDLIAALAAAAYLALAATSDRMPYVMLHNGLLAPLFAILVLALAASTGPMAAALSSRPLLMLGESSYGMYLLHLPLVVAMRSVWPSEHVGAAFIAVYAAVLFTLPPLLFTFFESPARDRIRSRFASSSAARGALADGRH